MKRPEIMSPAGDWPSLRAAIEAGADSVYLGISGPSMRPKGGFSFEEMKDVVKLCHDNKVKVYVTLNSLVYEVDLGYNEKVLKLCKELGIDAVICWDVSVISMARGFGIPIHLSTQASVSNSEAINFYKSMGVSRVVLARECKIDQICELIKKTDIELECFVHGAMCMAISGRCFLSQFTDSRSANRGVCIQNCRREYTVIDDEGKKLKLGNNYILSAEDLCSILFIEKLIEAGISCFKIEGRNRGPEYVKKVTSCYRRAVDSYFVDKKNFSKLKSELMKELKEVYNRGQNSGFFLGDADNMWNNVYGSKSTKMKVQIGRVENYYSKIGVAEVKVFSGEINKGDNILFIGNTTGVVEQEVSCMQIDHKEVKSVGKGGLVAIKTEKKVREGDTVFLWKDR